MFCLTDKTEIQKSRFLSGMKKLMAIRYQGRKTEKEQKCQVLPKSTPNVSRFANFLEYLSGTAKKFNYAFLFHCT